MGKGHLAAMGKPSAEGSLQPEQIAGNAMRAEVWRVDGTAVRDQLILGAANRRDVAHPYQGAPIQYARL